MEHIFGLVVVLIMEIIYEASKSPKVPKPLRYILIGLTILFFAAFFVCIFIAGIWTLKKTVPGGIVIIAFGLLMLILCIRKFRKTYLNRK